MYAERVSGAAVRLTGILGINGLPGWDWDFWGLMDYRDGGNGAFRIYSIFEYHYSIMKRQVLLLSSSRPNRQAVYFSHARGAIENILKGVHRLLFIPYAAPGGATYSAYTGSIREAFAGVGLPQQVEGIEAYKDPVMAIREAEAVFIGGGNTFLLLKTLYDAELLTPLRQRVAEGMPYIGSSAGSNTAPEASAAEG